MPDETAGTQGGAEQKTGDAAQSAGKDGQAAGDVKTFSQGEVDRIVRERLERERSKYADYDEAKRAAARLKEIEDSQKTDQEKLAGRLAELETSQAKAKDEWEAKIADAEARRIEAETEAASLRRRTRVADAAMKAGAIDPTDANILAATATIDPAGQSADKDIEAAIEALKKTKPYLFKQAGARVEPFNPGAGTGGAQTDQQIVARLRSQVQSGRGPFG